jgi:hypothetical protein
MTFRDLALSLFVLGALRLSVPAAESKGITVTAIINSGEENPSWEIQSEREIARLKQLLSNLPKTQPAHPFTLGWRGWLLTTHHVPGLPEQIEVFQGIIRITDEGRTEYFRDAKGLNDWLLKQARNHGISTA